MAKKKKKVSEADKKKKLKLAKLAWQILGLKFLYYEGANNGIKESVPDSEYDAIEDEYKELCEELDEEPTACNMVGFDSSRPSCRMVMEHLIATNGKCPIRSKRLSIKDKENPIQEARKKTNVFLKELADILEEVGIDEKKAKKIRIRMKKRFKA